MLEIHGFPDDPLCQKCSYLPHCTYNTATLCAAGLLFPPVPAGECSHCHARGKRLLWPGELQICEDCYYEIIQNIPDGEYIPVYKEES